MEIAPESKEFLIWLFTDLRKDLAERAGVKGQGSPDPEKAARDLVIFDALLAGLTQEEDFPVDEAVLEYLTRLAQATDKENEYERVSLEHKALGELGNELAKQNKLETVNGRFAVNLKRIRADRGLSQEALAELAGIHRTELSLLERGQREPRLGTLVKLAGALEASIGELTKDIKFSSRGEARGE